MATESDEEPNGANGNNQIPLKKVTAYQKLKRDLSEDEIVSSGALKLMLNDIDRLNEDISNLERFRDDFYKADKEKAILQEKLNINLSKEVLYSITITLGAVLIGLCPAIWEKSSTFGCIELACGVVLLFGGIFSKFR